MNTLRLARHLRPLSYRTGLAQQCSNPFCTPVSQIRYSKSVTTPTVPTSSAIGAPPEWAIMYSNMTREAAEKKLNISIDKLPIVPLEEMLGPIPEISRGIKEEVYRTLVKPSGACRYAAPPGSNWKGPNDGDLFFFAITPVLFDIVFTFGLQAKFYRAEAIDEESQEREGMNLIKFREERYGLVIEAKQDNTWSGLKQLLLGMKDVAEHSGPVREVYYGSTTTGVAWRMVDYDGKDFRISTEMDLVFDGMAENKDKWLKDCSVVVDCLHFGFTKSL